LPSIATDVEEEGGLATLFCFRQGEYLMKIIPLAALAALFATEAMAQASHRGTVNDVSEAEINRARAAIVRAGYTPTVLQFAQAGNLFFTATKDGAVSEVTVTPSGETYFSNGLPPPRS
jgi:hypothetical protein